MELHVELLKVLECPGTGYSHNSKSEGENQNNMSAAWHLLLAPAGGTICQVFFILIFKFLF